MGEDDTMSSELFIGIDVSKDRLDIAVRPTTQSLSFENTDTGVDELIHQLSELSPTLIVMEATGRYHQLALGRLVAASLPAIAINPLVHSFYSHPAILGLPCRVHPLPLPS